MADIASVALSLPRETETVIWDLLTDVNANGSAIERGAGEMSLQVSGTFGGASVALHGSMDGTTYAALPDLGGTAIAIGAAGIKRVGASARYLKVVTTGGGGTQSLKAMLHIRR